MLLHTLGVLLDVLLSQLSCQTDFVKNKAIKKPLCNTLLYSVKLRSVDLSTGRVSLFCVIMLMIANL